MPTKREHIDKQRSTQITLSYLQQSQNSPQHADWIVTLAFYKALHALIHSWRGKTSTQWGTAATRRIPAEMNMSKNTLVRYTRNT